MNEDMIRNEEIKESTEVAPVETNYVSTDNNSGSSKATIAVVAGVGTLLAGAAAFGIKKLKKHNEKKTIERLRKEGWYIEEPMTEEEDYEDYVDDLEPEKEVPESDEK